MSLADGWKINRSDGPRILTVVPICLEWETIGGDVRRARGTTHDIAHLGVCANMSHPLAVGLWVQFEVTFPTDLTGNHPWKFDCRGPVVRCENVRDFFAIAVSIRTRQLIENPKLHRRSHSRVIPSSLITAERLKIHAVVRNLTHAGAFLEVPDPLPAGEELELLIRGPELPTEIQVRSVVRYLKPRVGMGVEFVALSAEADSLLRQFTKANSRAA
jgi:PilZ domain-containing protein